MRTAGLTVSARAPVVTSCGALRDSRRFEGSVQVEHLPEADAGDEPGGGRHGDPAAHMRVTRDHRAGGLREGDDTGRPLERFEATRDLRLLDGEPIRREGGRRPPRCSSSPMSVTHRSSSSKRIRQLSQALRCGWISPVAHRRAS